MTIGIRPKMGAVSQTSIVAAYEKPESKILGNAIADIAESLNTNILGNSKEQVIDSIMNQQLMALAVNESQIVRVPEWANPMGRYAFSVTDLDKQKISEDLNESQQALVADLAEGKYLSFKAEKETEGYTYLLEADGGAAAAAAWSEMPFIPGNTMGSGTISYWAPMLINVLRRTAPALIAPAFCGIQPMATPKAHIMALRARYDSQERLLDNEALFQNIRVGYTGDGTDSTYDDKGMPLTTGKAMPTSKAELLGNTEKWPEMFFTIESIEVEANTRAIYSSYSQEMFQDVMAMYGLNTGSILVELMATEIAIEQNRQLIETMLICAKVGCQDTAEPGVYDFQADADGRWAGERLQAFVARIDLEALEVQRETRRGKANVMLCSAKIAGALSATRAMSYHASTNYPILQSDISKTSYAYAGRLNSGIDVYVDPYIECDYVCLAYKGAQEWDAGIYYCPYVPLSISYEQNSATHQQTLAMKERSGIAANPYYATLADGTDAPGKGFGLGENGYFRKFIVTNLIL